MTNTTDTHEANTPRVEELIRKLPDLVDKQEGVARRMHKLLQDVLYVEMREEYDAIAAEWLTEYSALLYNITPEDDTRLEVALEVAEEDIRGRLGSDFEDILETI